MALKIMVDGIIRDMTAEEEAEFMASYGETTDEEALTRYANSITGANDTTLVEAAETLITERIKEES